MALRGTLPVSVKDATRRRVRRAAELKSKHGIAYADAFAVATAVEFNAILLTGDPEIEPLEGEQNLKVEWLPRRPCPPPGGFESSPSPNLTSRASRAHPAS